MDSSFFQHIVTRAELYGIPFCHGAGIINIFQQRAVGKGIFCNFRYHAVQIYFFQVGKLRQCIATYAENALVHIHAGDCIALCAPGCSIRCFIVHHHRGFFDIQHTHGDVIFFILVRRIGIRFIRLCGSRVSAGRTLFQVDVHCSSAGQLDRLYKFHAALIGSDPIFSLRKIDRTVSVCIQCRFGIKARCVRIIRLNLHSCTCTRFARFQCQTVFYMRTLAPAKITVVC